MISVSKKGFTLIELIVVMAIVSLLVGLVGPFTIGSVERANAQAEALTLQNYFKRLSYLAYASQSPKQIELKTNTLKVLNVQTNEVKSRQFEYISFETGTLMLNKYGFFTPSTVSISYRKVEKTIDLNKLITDAKTQ
ncbi:type II secretion system protein [Pseudoalteromonas ruthenica]|uniref:type II secretion system protein n=1 Tax=Pseudoalteromonas ruthenica TaxID=151081 RepID=UPI00034B1123|nr:type II secretion system protein [Pseudoalteromonas ruthenica]